MGTEDKKRPTIAELEAMLEDETLRVVSTIPNGEVRAMTLQELCTRMRGDLLEIEKQARTIKGRPEMQGPESFRGQHGEMIAQSLLAVRHIEDARMRLGKVIQYSRDGVSIYDQA